MIPSVAVPAGAVALIGGAVWSVAQADYEVRCEAREITKEHADGPLHQRIAEDVRSINNDIDKINVNLDKLLSDVGYIRGRLEPAVASLPTEPREEAAREASEQDQ